MNPLLTLTALASYIEHVNAELAHVEASLTDTGSLRSSAKDIRLIRNIVGSTETANISEKVRGRVHKVELGGAVHNNRDDGVVPQGLDRAEDVGGNRSSVALDLVLQNAVGMCPVRGILGIHSKFSHSHHQSLCRVDNILVTVLSAVDDSTPT